jgi:hypothetical protein
MKRLLMIALLLMSAPAAAQTVLADGGDWSGVPEIQPRGEHRMSFASMNRIEELAKSGECTVSGLGRRQIDLSVPFILEFTPEGQVKTVVVRELGCDRLESIMGGVIIQLARAGEYKPTGENRLGWYRSELSFRLQ